MTNNRNYYTSSNYANTIPTREEFHRFTSNELSLSDFCTNHPTKEGGYQINKVTKAIRWTYANDRGRSKQR